MFTAKEAAHSIRMRLQVWLGNRGWMTDEQQEWQNRIQQAIDDAIALVDARWKEKQDGWFAQHVNQSAEVERLTKMRDAIMLRYLNDDGESEDMEMGLAGAMFNIAKEALELTEKRDEAAEDAIREEGGL